MIIYHSGTDLCTHMYFSALLNNLRHWLCDYFSLSGLDKAIHGTDFC